jgi:hypothetical protein
MTEETRVYVRHVRGKHLCMRGARDWFARYDLSWTEFLNNGYPVSVIEGTGCPIGREAAEAARREAEDADGR